MTIAMTMWISRRTGNPCSLLTRGRAVWHRVRGTRRHDWYIVPGDPVGVLIVPQIVATWMPRELEPGQAARCEVPIWRLSSALKTPDWPLCVWRDRSGLYQVSRGGWTADYLCPAIMDRLLGDPLELGRSAAADPGTWQIIEELDMREAA